MKNISTANNDPDLESHLLTLTICSMWWLTSGTDGQTYTYTPLWTFSCYPGAGVPLASQFFASYEWQKFHANTGYKRFSNKLFKSLIFQSDCISTCCWSWEACRLAECWPLERHYGPDVNGCGLVSRLVLCGAEETLSSTLSHPAEPDHCDMRQKLTSPHLSTLHWHAFSHLLVKQQSAAPGTPCADTSPLLKCQFIWILSIFHLRESTLSN